MRGDEGVVILFSPPLGGIADIFLRYKYAVFMACTR